MPSHPQAGWLLSNSHPSPTSSKNSIGFQTSISHSWRTQGHRQHQQHCSFSYSKKIYMVFASKRSRSHLAGRIIYNTFWYCNFCLLGEKTSRLYSG